MLGHVICDVCAICTVLSEIGRRGNSKPLREHGNLYYRYFWNSGNLSYSADVEKYIVQRPVFSLQRTQHFTQETSTVEGF